MRTSPIPSAPLASAMAASVGVSALARTLMRRVSSAHRMTLARSALSPTAEIRETEPRITSPSSPSREITSPSLNFASLPWNRTVPSRSLTNMSPQPTTQGLPQPRATTAACDVMPPLAVRMPTLACIPPTSSALVSTLTRTQSSPRFLAASASAAVNATVPTAAPGDAGRPFATTSFSRSYGRDGSNLGRKSCEKNKYDVILIAHECYEN